MSNSRNRVQLVGHLGGDPEVKILESGKKVARFTVATNSGHKNTDGQMVTETTWHNIVAWNGQAELAEKILKKGYKIDLEGRLSYRSFEDKKGVTRYITEIVLGQILDSSAPSGKKQAE